MGSPTDQWLHEIWAEHPELPRSLTPEVEQSHLPRLSGWFEDVQEIRERYIEKGAEILSEKVQEMDGGRQVLPVFESLSMMTEDETQAWRELFSCSAKLLAKYATKYWEVHEEDLHLKIDDVLNYLPAVFLITLSQYDAEHLKGDADQDWSRAETPGKVRLSTWLQQDVRRHIKKYLQKCSANLSQGPAYLQRLRDEILSFRDKFYVEHGEEPTTNEIVEEIKDYYYAQSISEKRLRKHVRKLNRPSTPGMKSLDKKEDEQDERTLGERLANDNISDRAFDASDYFIGRMEKGPALTGCLKIVENSDALTFAERKALL